MALYNVPRIEFEAADSAVRNILTTVIDAYCWFRGYTQVTERQVQLAQTIAFHVDGDDQLDLEAVTEVVLNEDGGVLERRVRRARKAPFVSWLVQTIRGQHLSQCSRTESNVLVFERHARAIMSEHGVRPTDAARVLPLATATFFEHRSVDQIDGVAIIQAPAFVKSRQLYSASYYCNGRVAALQQRA